MTITIENRALLIDGVQIKELPRLARPAAVTVWSVPTDYMSDGYYIDVTPRGLTQSVPACDSSQTVLLDVLELEADETAMADEARAKRLAQVNEEANELLSQLDAAYPDREVLTWDQQVKEAEARQADAQASIPLLAALAQYRAIDVDLLAAKVLEKSMLYKVASGQIMGARQWVEQELEAAQTHEEVLQVPTVTERYAAAQAEAQT